MNLLDQIAKLQAELKKLRKEKLELKKELEYTKLIELEAVRRYDRVANELLLYYIKYGIIDNKERKKKK